jgi:hypothetical protein
VLSKGLAAANLKICRHKTGNAGINGCTRGDGYLFRAFLRGLPARFLGVAERGVQAQAFMSTRDSMNFTPSVVRSFLCNEA